MKKSILFLFTILFTSTQLLAQPYRSPIRMATGITVAYDSNTFKTDEYYTKKKIEDRVTFIHIKDPLKKRQIDLQATETDEEDFDEPDTLIRKEVNDYVRSLGGSATVVEKDNALRKAGKFTCYGVVVQYKLSKEYSCYIICRRSKGKEMLDIRLTNPVSTTLDKEYKVLEEFMKGIRFIGAGE